MDIKNIKADPWLMTAEACAIYSQCMFKATFEKYQQEIAEIAAKQECSIFACRHNGQFAGIITLEKISEDITINGYLPEQCFEGIPMYF